jgi:nitrite reductase/ring-hydroxylating ferredoxin subunit
MLTEICTFQSLPYKYHSTIFNDEIILYEYEDKLIAISSFCPHFGGPLEIGEGVISCYWHNWIFDICNHHCINKKIKLSIRSYKIERISPIQAIIQYAD